MMLKTFILLALLIPGQSPAPKNVSSEALGAVQYEVRYKLGALDTKVADATMSCIRTPPSAPPPFSACS